MKRTCSDIQQDLPDFLDNRLSDPMKDEIESHLESCTECGDYLEFLQGVQSSVSAVQVPDPDDQYWQSMKTRITESVYPEKYIESTTL